MRTLKALIQYLVVRLYSGGQAQPSAGIVPLPTEKTLPTPQPSYTDKLGLEQAEYLS